MSQIKEYVGDVNDQNVEFRLKLWEKHLSVGKFIDILLYSLI